jgi:hypothetical protein
MLYEHDFHEILALEVLALYPLVDDTDRLIKVGHLSVLCCCFFMAMNCLASSWTVLLRFWKGEFFMLRELFFML